MSGTDYLSGYIIVQSARKHRATAPILTSILVI